MRPERTGTFDPVGRHLANEAGNKKTHGEVGRREEERSASHPEREEGEGGEGEGRRSSARVGGRTCYSTHTAAYFTSLHMQQRPWRVNVDTTTHVRNNNNNNNDSNNKKQIRSLFFLSFFLSFWLSVLRIQVTRISDWPSIQFDYYQRFVHLGFCHFDGGRH